MSAHPLPVRRYSVEEYFDLLDSSPEKWEFFDGEVFRWDAMAGATDPHVKISNNASRRFDDAFEEGGKPCTSLGSDAVLAIPKLRRYRFPDVTIQCGTPEYDGRASRGRTNPTLIVEVMSDSSRQADQGTQFMQYTGIVSLREYVLIEQDYPLVILHSRPDHRTAWTTTIHTDLSEQLYFPSVDVTISLGRFYQDITWDEDGAVLSPGAGVPTQGPSSDGSGDLAPPEVG